MENLQELTECCICTEIFTDPRILPCVHTFCFNCLQQTAVKNEINAEEKMPCPFCRREFVIPTEGMSGLQKNFFMDRLVEITKLSKPVDKATLCEICIEENETEACDIPTATNYCIQCRKNTCNLCCRYHKKFSEYKDHELLPLGCPMKEELIQKFAAQCCDKHSKEKAKLFCSDCKEVICKKYCEENHQLHKCTDIEACADSFRKQILNTIQRVSTFSKDVVLKSERFLSEKSDFLKYVEREETAVVTRGKILKDLIDKCTQSLLDELNSIKLSQLKQMETAKDENEFQKGILESFNEYCRELTSKGSSVEICRSAFNINNREVELKQMHERQMKSIKVSFKPLNLEELLKTENVVGKIKVEKRSGREGRKAKVNETVYDGRSRVVKKSVREERKANVTERSDVGQREVGKKLEVEGRRTNITQRSDLDLDEVSILSSVQLDVPSAYVNGVTKLLNNIYVLSGSCHSIYVFGDRSPFCLQEEIKINEIKDPKNIAAIEDSDCLYVTENNCIWGITATEDHRVKKWVANESQLFSLSASSDGHLLVLTNDQARRNYVEIYRSDAKLIRRFLLPLDIESPLHIIQTLNGEFIISHRNAKRRPWVISRLTSDGHRMIHKLNPSQERVSQKVNYPWHLSLDSDKNRLFVAEGSRVSVFDSNSLSMKKILLTMEVNSLHRLHYDAKEKQLIVAQTAGKVNINKIN